MKIACAGVSPTMLSVLVLGLLALPVSIASSLQVVERIHSPPRDWAFVREAKDDELVKLRISVRQQNVEYFEQLIMDVSTPDHPSYGNHLSKDEVANILRPSSDASSTVVAWLKGNDVDGYRIDREIITFWTNVSQANAMMDTHFAWYRNHVEQQEKLRTLEYSMPSDVAQHVDFVEPTIKFPSLRRMKSAIHAKGPKPGSANALSTLMDWKLASGADSDTVAPPDAVCNLTITPQCLLNLYNVHYAADPTNGNKVAYASFLNEFAQNTDLTLFETTQAMYAQGQTFSVVQFNGGGNTQGPTNMNDSTEANLDNQYIVGVAYPVPVTEYSTGGCGPLIADPNEPQGACDNEPYMEFLTGILALPDASLPQTLSISYGEDEQTWPLAMANKVCNMFAQLGARGTSVLIASGDSAMGAICENNNGTVLKYVPNFPVSCPYVTGVGSTQNIKPEQAASFSGGGFSNYFGRPAYQSAMVSTYLKSIGSNQAAYFNRSGRAYPDVSAQGVDFLVVDKGLVLPVDGTSASSPTFASVIALLNSARISQGLKPLGFLNPFLYANYLGLNDITVGAATGCDGSTGNIPNASWNAIQGWDPATGLGTPDLGKLLALAAPGACNIGGPLPNPTLSSCPPYTPSTSSTSTKTSTSSSSSKKTTTTTTTTTKPTTTTTSKPTTTTTTKSTTTTTKPTTTTTKATTTTTKASTTTTKATTTTTKKTTTTTTTKKTTTTSTTTK